MNWAQFKDPVSHMCLAGAVVASWSLTRGGWEAGSSPFTVITTIFVTKFSENKFLCHLRNLIVTFNDCDRKFAIY